MSSIINPNQRGPQGTQGIQGVQGNQGIQGVPGSTGATGATGSPGAAGTAATIAVGTVTTGAPGSSATIVNAGSSSAAIFNFSIPRGDVGATGAAVSTGATGPAGPSIVSSPTVVSPVFGTAYAATTPTKPSFISAMIDAAYSITVAGTMADTVELRIGPVQATVANGTGGTAVATFRASLTGIALTIGLGLGQRNQLSALVPVGWFWALRRVAGTTATISSATDQSIG